MGLIIPYDNEILAAMCAVDGPIDKMELAKQIQVSDRVFLAGLQARVNDSKNIQVLADGVRLCKILQRYFQFLVKA